MAEATSTTGSASAGEPVTGLAYGRAYLTLFAAHWFGARRFDRVEHLQGFDPEDVQAYRAQKTHHLKKNFARAQRVCVTAPAAAAAAETEQPRQHAVTQIAEGGAGALGNSAADEGAPAGQVEAGQAEDGQPQRGQASSGGTEVRAVTRVVTSKQAFPRFVVMQCILMCGLWVAFALKRAMEEGMTGTDPWLAGLDSISRGSTDLRWSGPKCEDYRGDVWRWFTYQWTHIGVGHVLSNTILLVVFGFALEGHEGSLRMFIIWNAGVIAGALSWFVNGAHGYVVGASGGVYALVGLQFEDLIMNWRERHFRKLSVAILLGFAGIDATTWMVSQDLTKSDYSYSVAVGGGLAGLVVGSYIGKNYLVTKKDKLVMAGLSCLACVLVIFALLWLGLNDAPLSVWEAGSGENGYCWVGQFFNPRINATSYQCIRCGSQECIQEWTFNETVLSVNARACDAQGFYFDGR